MIWSGYRLLAQWNLVAAQGPLRTSPVHLSNAVPYGFTTCPSAPGALFPWYLCTRALRSSWLDRFWFQIGSGLLFWNRLKQHSV
ncbi:hypothetical protein BJX66DRAFT_319181 [Aspergillus keveii]|uniref:Secreted protein n=1 Tax=Aspergillus keveii TaxID=714993 RepID=A0ABR4FIL0_9EURO